MTIKAHYLITICALFILGMIISKPGITKDPVNPEKTYENRISLNSDVRYKLN